MKINLEYPYNELYKRAYLRICKDNRKRVDLINSKTDRTTISYARYLVSIREKRLLTINEEVDHNDNDKTNDNLDNLIIRTIKDHLEKTLANRSPATLLSFICPVCNNEFKRRKGLEGINRIPKCSRKCNGIASKRIQLGP